MPHGVCRKLLNCSKTSLHIDIPREVEEQSCNVQEYLAPNRYLARNSAGMPVTYHHHYYYRYHYHCRYHYHQHYYYCYYYYDYCHDNCAGVYQAQGVGQAPYSCSAEEGAGQGSQGQHLGQDHRKVQGGALAAAAALLQDQREAAGCHPPCLGRQGYCYR